MFARTLMGLAAALLLTAGSLRADEVWGGKVVESSSKLSNEVKVTVTAVKAGSRAAAAGLKGGDRIVRIGEQNITSAEGLQTALDRAWNLGTATSKVVLIEVFRPTKSDKVQQAASRRMTLEVTLRTRDGKVYIADSVARFRN